VVDDDADFVEGYVMPALSKDNDWAKEALANLDFRVKSVGSQQEAKDELGQRKQNYDIALVDLRLKASRDDLADSDEAGGLKLLPDIQPLRVIMFTGDDTGLAVETAFQAITQQNVVMGYLFKDYSDVFQKQLLLEVRRAWHDIERERNLREAERRILDATGLLGESAVMIHVKDRIVQAAASKDASVLIMGETGTGKELVARAIYQSSQRKNQAFVPLNCGAIPKELFESELFGYERGAFSGATARTTGKFELADGGILFLDEIGAMPIDLQQKILRPLQEKKIMRLGGKEEIDLDVRIIAATNVDLSKAVERREFRQDLYHRLNIIPIRVPPLRERKEDIPLLVRHFIEKYSLREGKVIYAASTAVLNFLIKQDWPGNVRELENTIYRAIVFAPNQSLSLEDLQEAVDHRTKESQLIAALPQDLKEMIDESFCQEYNRWCRQNGKGSRRIEPEEILGILAVAFEQRKIQVKACEEEPLGLRHEKASTALAFLASRGFLRRMTERGPYFFNEGFDASALNQF